MVRVHNMARHLSIFGVDHGGSRAGEGACSIGEVDGEAGAARNISS